MASPILDGSDDGKLVVLICIDPHQEEESDRDEDDDEVRISTTDVDNWNFPSILQHRIIKVQAHRNRLMEHSSYFHGLLGGNFRDSYLEVLVEWKQPAFLSLLTSLFGTPVEVTSENVLSLLEGALFFGMEIVLLKCKTWLTRAMTGGVSVVQLNFLINIWKFGCEQMSDYIPELCAINLARNFPWAMSCISFSDVPHELLLSGIKHSHLNVESEKQLCEALLAWIAANKERSTKDACIDLLKQIRIGLLPLWFAAGKSTYQSLCICFNKSFIGATTLLKETFARYMDTSGDSDLLDLRIRLSEFTQKMDLSGCPQMQPTILFLSMLPCSFSSEPLLRKKVKQLFFSHERHGGKNFQISSGIWPNLTFETVCEIDISNCPMLHLEVVGKCFSKSFPSLRTLKAANHLSFRTIKLWDLVERCPLLCDIDLSVDVSPVIPTQVSILTTFPAITLKTSYPSIELPGSLFFDDSDPLSNMPGPLGCNITKLTLDGRIDISDSDLKSISDICVSLTYLSLKGCNSFSDGDMSRLIWKCVNLNSVVACDTLFGQESIQVLCTSNARFGRIDAPRSLGSNLQMLHIGGCKGINMTSFSEFLSQASKMKSLCLRETEVVDDSLYKFIGSSLELLDVSNTKVSAAAVAHVVGRNPGLQCLKTRGCANSLQQENKTEEGKFSAGEPYFEFAKSCKLDEISAGWGFSCLSLEVLKPAVSLLKAIEVGLGGSLGHEGLKRLPGYCRLLESVVLYFQVISDQVIINMLESLRHLKSFALCHCLGETSSLSLKVSMPNLRKLRLERVAPWMKNVDLVSLSQNCVNLLELSLLGCRLLNSESQKIISSGWPGLMSIHLEECGDVTSNGVVSLLDCSALEDILLRHNGPGIQKDFICDAVSELPMLRKISLDTCDAKDGDFDIPDFNDMRHFLSHVKIARCKPQKHTLALRHIKPPRPLVHSETLILVRDSKQLTRTVVKERL